MEEKKYLPIKIVEKRKEKDESLTEAGGNSDLPAWMLKISLEERAEMISVTLDEAGDELDKRVRNDNFIPVAIEFKLDSKTLAKSHRSSVREIIDVNRKNNLIGYL